MNFEPNSSLPQIYSTVMTIQSLTLSNIKQKKMKMYSDNNIDINIKIKVFF